MSATVSSYSPLNGMGMGSEGERSSLRGLTLNMSELLKSPVRGL